MPRRGVGSPVGGRVKISVVIVTRGDVDLEPIIEREWPEPFHEIVVWNNAEEERDMKVYGRYAAIRRANFSRIYVQDDDCVLPFDSLKTIAEAYEPGRLVANMPRSRWEGYPDSSLVGWGAIFDKDLPAIALGRFADGIGLERAFQMSDEQREDVYITCDVMFSALTPRTIIDVPFDHLPWAEGPDRMFTGRPTHNHERQRMLELCRTIRGEDDDRRDW